MSYAIIRIQKMTSGTVKGIQIHDQREKEYSHTNSDIDFSKSNLNEDLHNSEKINFNHKVKERIQELNLTRAVRKDAIVMCQCLITSDKTFFDNLSTVEQKKFFDDSFKFVKDRYCEKNIVSATVHYDEKTPHMHVNFVPVTHDGRLCAKDIFKRADLSKLHDDFHKHCKEHGYDLERGESNGQVKKHLSVEEYKLETKRQEIEKNKTELDKTYNAIKIDSEAVKEVQTNIWELEHLEVKKGFLGSKITLKIDDYKNIVDMAKQGVYNSDKIIKLEKENLTLKRDNNNIKEDFKRVLDINTKLKEQNIALKNKSKNLKQQYIPMLETIDKHGLLPEVLDRLKTISQVEKEAKKPINKSQSMGLER